MRPAQTLLLLAILALLLPGSSFALSLKIGADPDRYQFLELLAAEIRVRTEGRVVLELQPHAARTGDVETLARIRRGELDGAILSSSSLGRALPALHPFALPLRFDSLQALDAIRVELEQPYRRALRRAGFESFGWIEEEFLVVDGTLDRDGELRPSQKLWQCSFSTLVIEAKRFAGLSSQDRKLLLAILLRSSTGLDRHSRQQNLEAWQVPLLPANATTQSRRHQGPPSGAGA
ncbi:MAG: type 2 periplasmic-binding domain-containing protein [Trichloromonadaceae bacterium]